jgi:protein ImuA
MPPLPDFPVGVLRSALWRADQLDAAPCPASPTGWPALDRELPGGGWPLTGLSELLGEPGGGELALLLPWLHARSQVGELVWIAPPWTPCAAALQQAGLAPSRLVCLDPASAADAAWSAELALRAGPCAAVLWWCGSAPLAPATLRRLHLAAQAGASPLIALRPARARASSSPAPLRLACQPQGQRMLQVEVFKRRGPPMAQALALPLPRIGSETPSRTATPVTADTPHRSDRPLPIPASARRPTSTDAPDSARDRDRVLASASASASASAAKIFESQAAAMAAAAATPRVERADQEPARVAA